MSENTKPKRQYRRRKSPVVSATESSAPVESVPVASEPAPPVPAGPPRLTAHEIYQIRLAEAEIRTALAEKDAARLRRLYFLALLDPKGTVLAQDKKLAEKEALLREAQNRFKTLRAKVGNRLGVDMSKAGIDVETGEVMVAPSA